MMRLSRWLVLCWLSLASSGFAQERPRVVVLQIDGSSDTLKRVGAAVSEQVLTELQRSGHFEAVGASDVQVLLGLERQKAVLGCAPDVESACLAEISAALGAPWLVTGSLAQFGNATRLDLKLINTKDGKASFRDGASFTNESGLFSQVSDIVKRMISTLEGSRAIRQPSVFPTVTSVSGAVLVLVGAGVLLGGGTARSETMTRLTALEYGQAKLQLEQANTLLLVGAITAGAGIAALFSGLAWWSSTRMVKPRAAVSVSPGGLVVFGSF